jgi:hypothetical protein
MPPSLFPFRLAPRPERRLRARAEVALARLERAQKLLERKLPERALLEPQRAPPGRLL